MCFFYFAGGRVKCFLLRKLAHHVGNDVYYGARAQITYKEHFTIGDCSGIPRNAWFDATGSIKIGNNVMIGPECMIFSANHKYQPEGSLIGLGHIPKQVVISDNCWIGARTIILPGVEIAEGIIIGAGSVVTKSLTQKNSIYAGNPAVYKKSR